MLKIVKYALLKGMQDENLIHNFNSSNNTRMVNKSSVNGKVKPPIILFVVLALLGIGTGFLLSQTIGSGAVSTSGGVGSKESVAGLKKGEIFGSKESNFKDSAEGTLRVGGIEGEGAYHLERPGGESQNVYMTSSVIDLSQFVGKKVKVWGETNAAEKAGWLMDVGRLQLL